MAFVLDSSIATGWALLDGESPLADSVAERLKQEIALVPSIWWYEIRNILMASELRQRITPGDTANFLEILASYPIQVEAAQDEQITLSFARQNNISIFGASYLAVAHRHRAPLATLDEKLQAAARSAGIALLS